MNWTDEQLAVIEHADGHAKVSAVAGSGKSATLVERVARLLGRGFQSSRIQVLMFNASACAGFNHRLRTRLRGIGAAMPEVRTFHSVGMRLCETMARHGHIPNWRLESQDWVESKMAADALEAILGEKPSSDEVEPFLDFISLVKSDIISADDKYPEATEITGKPMPAHFVQAYGKFEQLRELAGIRFFSDLIHDPVMKLLSDQELADRIGGKLDHLLVDEYQDVNEVQQALLTIIAGQSASVMVVGDVDQCIYEWRGARPEYLQTLFDADFPDAANYRLSYTFRYGHRISLLANHIISHNQRRDDKMCLSYPSTPDTHITIAAEGGGGHPAVEALKSWVDKGRSLSEAAILVRLYGMSAPIELALLQERIPYRLDGRESVFQRREARMIFGYLRLAANRLHYPSPDGGAPDDYIDAMLTLPSIGLPKQAVRRIGAELLRHPGAARQVIENAIFSGDIPDWRARKLRARAMLFDRVSQATAQAKAADVLKIVTEGLKLDESVVRESVRQETGRDRLEVCHSLIDFTGMRTVDEALREIDELMAEAAASAFESRPNAVTITSIHKAKGLEWPFVILPGMREGGIPVEGSVEEGPRTEAERRLCYVGITRAQEELLMVHPADTDLAYFAGAGICGPDKEAKPIASRFLYEGNVLLSGALGAALHGAERLDLEGVDVEVCRRYLDRLGRTDISVEKIAPPKRSGGIVCGPRTPCRATKGMRVEHAQFGRGEVLELIQRASTTAIRLKFDRGGERIVIANLAELVEVESSQATVTTI